MVIVETLVVLVEDAERVQLRLAVPQLVDALTQRRETQRRATEMSCQKGEMPVRRILDRGQAGKEQLHPVEVATVGQAQMRLALVERLQHRVQAAFLLGLILE